MMFLKVASGILMGVALAGIGLQLFCACTGERLGRRSSSYSDHEPAVVLCMVALQWPPALWAEIQCPHGAPAQEWLAREDSCTEEKAGAARGVPCLYTRTASLEQAGGLQRMTLRGHTGGISKVLLTPGGIDVITGVHPQEQRAPGCCVPSLLVGLVEWEAHHLERTLLQTLWRLNVESWSDAVVDYPCGWKVSCIGCLTGKPRSRMLTLKPLPARSLGGHNGARVGHGDRGLRAAAQRAQRGHQLRRSCR